jgi:signal transduction histidine kinase
VRLRSVFWGRSAAVGLTVVLIAVAIWGIHRRNVESRVPHHVYQLTPDRLRQWQAVGGQWEMADGTVYNNSYERGAKLLTGSTDWRNSTLTTDFRFSGTNADMGVIIRTNHEKKGTDTYDGYYIGVRTLDGTLVVGRADFGWREARPVKIPGVVQPMVWYRLTVTAYGCDIAASVLNLDTHQTASIAFRDSYCLARGRIGLRSLNAGGMWRNISIAPAGWNDYLSVRRNAGSVERLEALPGPPWWTPWHAAVLFSAAFAVALLLQLVYFRVQQWKTYTIMRERERFAHEIHDTMAQGFAGIGYQIQGIRHSIVTGGEVNSQEIASELGVAYQLVRKCHEEASRTIAMLGSRSPSIRDSILAALVDTANKIAGTQIRIVTELHGNAKPLNLRVADALLHVGREAIVNAVSYANPNLLQLTLSYVGDQVELVVEDNGCGFEYKPESAGFGILGMQKHARDVGAVLEITSSPQSGTRVAIKALLQQETFRMRIISETKARLWRILGFASAK